MVRCTWDRTDDQAAEQTAHPTAVRAGGRVFNSHRCTQIDEEPFCLPSRVVSGQPPVGTQNQLSKFDQAHFGTLSGHFGTAEAHHVDTFEVIELPSKCAERPPCGRSFCVRTKDYRPRPKVRA